MRGEEPCPVRQAIELLQEKWVLLEHEVIQAIDRWARRYLPSGRHKAK